MTTIKQETCSELASELISQSLGILGYSASGLWKS